MISIFDMTDSELKEFLTTYEAGEVLSTEAEIDYVMARLPDFFSGRPKLVNYEITDKARAFFDKLDKECEAEGLNLSLDIEE